MLFLHLYIIITLCFYSYSRVIDTILALSILFSYLEPRTECILIVRSNDKIFRTNYLKLLSF